MVDSTIKQELKILRGRLGGIKKVVERRFECSKEILDDYNDLVKTIGELLQIDYSPFLAKEGIAGSIYSKPDRNRANNIKDKLYQFLPVIDAIDEPVDMVAPVGRLYQSISDSELRERCIDILSAKKHFDRVINQATLVLENRIRIKANLEKNDIGMALVNKALNSDVEKSKLVVSKDPKEHIGICDICRGIMTAYRNPTHHYLTDKYSREDALKVCVFIDHLLFLIDNSQLKDG